MSATPMKSLKRLRVATLLLSFLGIGLSGYAVYVSYRKEANNEYRAYCDIDESMSCSKVFTSKYGKGFGFLDLVLGKDSPAIVSNGIYGIAFYILVALLGEFSSSLIAAHLQRFLVLVTNVVSAYLAYILFFVLKDKCVVCIATYTINILLAVCCFLRVKNLNSVKGKKKGSAKSNANEKPQKNNKNQKKEKNQNGKIPSPKAEKQNKNEKAKTQTVTKVNNKNLSNSNKNLQNSTKNQNSNKTAQITNKNNQNSNKNSGKSSTKSTGNNKKKN